MENLLIVVGLVFVVSCSSGQGSKDDKKAVRKDEEEFNYGDALEEAVVGSWKNNTIDVDMHTYNNMDTSFHIAVNESSWKIMMDMNPIYTTIKEDGTFFTEYRDTLNNVFHTNKGIWYIDGDSLFLEDENGYKFPYKIFVKDNDMEMETYVDYDGDGEKDDYYKGKYSRVVNNN